MNCGRRFLSRAAFAIVFAFGSLGHAGPLSNANGAADVEQAREQFRAGVEAARQSRWGAASQAFERSYAFAPRTATLLNLAGAQVQNGQLLSGIETYKKLLLNPHGDLTADQRNAATEALRTVESRIAHVRFNIDPLRDGERIELDATVLSRAALAGGEFPLDPGDHRVTVLHDGTVLSQVAIRVAEAESKVVRVPIVRTTQTAPPATPENSPSTSRGLLASPWFWTAVGVVVVSGVAVTYCVAEGCGKTEPGYSGSMGQVRFP